MDIFDILGPVMVGPSSSHTAGAVRIGRMANSLLGGVPARAKIHLHGSFAETGAGHGTDLALVSGLLGMQPDDLRIPDARREAEKAGMVFSVDTIDLRDAHPNTALIEAWKNDGRKLEMQASSLGGGRIQVNKIDGIEVNFSGDFNTLVIRNRDEVGALAAVTSFLTGEGINVANMRLSRDKRGGGAIMVIETDQKVSPLQLERISALKAVDSVTCCGKENEEDGI